MANNWSLLPYSILLNIAKHLSSIEDFLAFSSVCCSWRTVYTNKSWKPGSRVPWLMLSEDQNSESRGFHSLSSGKTYQLTIPEAQGKMCWGSALGWILTFGPDFMLRILNPVSRSKIDVARIVHFEHYCFPPSKEWYRLIYKAIVLRGLADDGDFLVAVIFYQGKYLSFKSGDGPWQMLENQVDLNYGFSDALCFEGKIYAIHGIGSLVLVEMDGHGAGLRATHFAPPPQDEWAWEDAYLVESSGDLLMVQKLECRGMGDVQFEVYKLDFSNKEWTRLDNLGDRSIFVGGNHSMAVSASRIGMGCKSNCIYFTADGVEQWWDYSEDAEGRDMGVYSMSDGSVEHFFYGADYPSHYSSPLWVVPSYY